MTKEMATIPWKVVAGRITLSSAWLEKRFGPAITLSGTVALPFVIPSEVEGSAVSADLSWKCFSELSVVEKSALLF
jgi:hypothetical protein